MEWDFTWITLLHWFDFSVYLLVDLTDLAGYSEIPSDCLKSHIIVIRDLILKSVRLIIKSSLLQF
jgi:hypothetical protein